MDHNIVCHANLNTNKTRFIFDEIMIRLIEFVDVMESVRNVNVILKDRNRFTTRLINF